MSNPQNIIQHHQHTQSSWDDTMTEIHASTPAQRQLGGTATNTNIMAQRPNSTEQNRIMSYLLQSRPPKRVKSVIQSIISHLSYIRNVICLYNMISKSHNLLQKMLRAVKRNHITQSYIEKQDLQSENVIQFTQKREQKKKAQWHSCQQPSNQAQHSIIESNGKQSNMSLLYQMPQTYLCIGGHKSWQYCIQSRLTLKQIKK